MKPQPPNDTTQDGPRCATHADVFLEDRDCGHCQDGYVEPEDEFDFSPTTCWRCNGTGVLRNFECWKCEEDYQIELEEQNRMDEVVNDGYAAYEKRHL